MTTEIAPSSIGDQSTPALTGESSDMPYQSAFPGGDLTAALDMEKMRIQRGWPTPHHMRRAADALDIMTPARYGEVLRWVADLCDAALGEPETRS